MTDTLDPDLAAPSEGNDFSYSTPDRLDRMLQKQDAFQAMLGQPLHGLAYADKAKATPITTEQILALEDELHELMGEYNWKSWAKGVRFDVPAARSEFIDAWHFMLNLANILGFDGYSLEAAYDDKLDKNIKRQLNGYDGISTKCPGCKRALDDTEVKCYPNPNFRLGGEQVAGVFCDRHGRFYKTGPAQ